MPCLARRSFLLSSLALVATATVGCGFRLRGHVDLPFETLFVNLPKNSQMGAQIRRVIKSGTHTTLVDEAAQAQAVLDLVSSSRHREVIALNTKGEAREYELTLKLTFRVASPDGEEFLPPTTFMASRTITYNESDYLSRDAEEGLLYKEMQQDLVSQLLNRISSLKPAFHAY